MRCRRAGCEEWVHRDKQYCWEHFKETVPAYADEISKALKEWLKYKGYENIVTERALAGGFTSIFDVVASSLDPLKIIGIEIKSDHDSYSRIDSQLPDYIDVFDEVYLCLGNKKAPYSPLVGILRFEDGKIRVEKKSMFYGRNHFEILSDAEMVAVSKANGLDAADSNRIRDAFRLMPSIRKKLIYNRFFAKMDWQNRFITEHLNFSEDELGLCVLN